MIIRLTRCRYSSRC